MSKNASRHRKTKRNRVEQEPQVVPRQPEQRRNRSVSPLVAKNDRQKMVLHAFKIQQMVILSGSAGTGKTELMCWWACNLWLSGAIDNIIITRPYKHLGADYGSTKGNDSEKLLPFCMSILMKLKKYLGAGTLKCNFKPDGFDSLFAEADGIQIVPLEKIQGMSFNDRTIILCDEAQNATVAQIKALTTRAEEGCQILVAGDPFQTALGPKNGLTFIENVLEEYPTEYATVVRFSKQDVVRGGLSGHLVAAFEEMGSW